MGKDAIGPHWRHRKINTLCHIHKKRPVEKLELLDRHVERHVLFQPVPGNEHGNFSKLF